jgi:glycosyltransferase involved in cell wall biosynthesis
MKIMFLSHYYPPEVNAPASRTSEHCRAWAKLGHDVTVVTCAPNHPGGTVYPGFQNRLFQTEISDGVRVIRLWTFMAANEGFLLRTLNYISFLVAVVCALPRLPKPDVVVSTSPQFFCGLAGLAVRTFKRVPWVLEVRDLWPESIITVGAMNKGVVTRALEAVERFGYRKADFIVAVTDSFVPHIVERGGTPSRIAIVKNGVDLALFQQDAAGAARIRSELKLEGKFIAAYVGTHGMAHGLSTILDAADRLRTNARIMFLLVGDGAERANLERQRQERQLENVIILGQRAKSDMPAIWTATDASLILLRRNDLFRKVLPSKMFEAMAMRRPIILGVEGESHELLAAAEAGIAIPPQDAAALGDAVLKLANDSDLAAKLGANGDTFVRANFDRAVLAQRYLKILDATIAGGLTHKSVPLSVVGADANKSAP